MLPDLLEDDTVVDMSVVTQDIRAGHKRIAPTSQKSSDTFQGSLRSPASLQVKAIPRKSGLYPRLEPLGNLF